LPAQGFPFKNGQGGGMANILISYDLNRAGQDYDALISGIQSLGVWWHCLDSTWIVITQMTSVQVCDTLAPLIDHNDELLVVDISGCLNRPGI
jgi:hypothetical protein